MKKLIFLISLFFCFNTFVYAAGLQCEYEKNVVKVFEQHSCNPTDTNGTDDGNCGYFNNPRNGDPSRSNVTYTKLVPGTPPVDTSKPYYIFVLVDDSGSMNSDRTYIAIESINNFVTKIKQTENCTHHTCKIKVSFFNGEGKVKHGGSRGSTLSGFNQNRNINDFRKSMFNPAKATGGSFGKTLTNSEDNGWLTNFEKGFSLARKWLDDLEEHHPNAIPFFYFVTDGYPTGGGTTLNCKNADASKCLKWENYRIVPMTSASLFFSATQSIYSISKRIHQKNGRFLAVGINVGAQDDVMPRFLLNPNGTTFGRLNNNTEAKRYKSLLENGAQKVEVVMKYNDNFSAGSLNDDKNGIVFSNHRADNVFVDFDSSDGDGVCFGIVAKKDGDFPDEGSVRSSFRLQYKNSENGSYHNMDVDSDHTHTRRGYSDNISVLAQDGHWHKKNFKTLCYDLTRSQFNTLKNAKKIRLKFTGSTTLLVPKYPKSAVSSSPTWKNKYLNGFEVGGRHYDVIDQFFANQNRRIDPDEYSTVINGGGSTPDSCGNNTIANAKVTTPTTSSCSSASVTIYGDHNYTIRVILKETINFKGGSLVNINPVIAGKGFHFDRIEVSNHIDFDFERKGARIQTYLNSSHALQPVLHDDNTNQDVLMSEVKKADGTRMFANETQLKTAVTNALVSNYTSLANTHYSQTNFQDMFSILQKDSLPADFAIKERFVDIMETSTASFPNYSYKLGARKIKMNNKTFAFADSELDGNNLATHPTDYTVERFYYTPFGYGQNNFTFVVRVGNLSLFSYSTQTIKCNVRVGTELSPEKYLEYRSIDLKNPFPRSGGDSNKIPTNWRKWYEGDNIARLENSYGYLDYLVRTNKFPNVHGSYSLINNIKDEDGSSSYVTNEYFDIIRASATGKNYCSKGNFSQDCNIRVNSG